MEDLLEVYYKIFREKYKTLRESQIYLLDKYENIRDKNKIIEIEAAPGSGKSLVNMIIGLYEGGDKRDIYEKIIISTRSKVLQLQYIEDFYKILRKHGYSVSIGVGLTSFKCKLNNAKRCEPLCYFGYKCKFKPIVEDVDIDKIEDSCAIGGYLLPLAIKFKKGIVTAIKYKEDICDYWKNIINILNSKVVFTNHYFLIVHTLVSELLPTPRVLIIDEFHSLYDVIKEYSELIIHKKMIKNYLNSIGLDENLLKLDEADLIEFLADIEFIKYLEEILPKTTGTQYAVLSDFIGRLKIIRKIIGVNDDKSIASMFEFTRKDKYVKITPTFWSIKNLIKNYIAENVLNKVIFTSATLPPEKIGERITYVKRIYSPENWIIVYCTDSPSISNNKILNKEVLSYLLTIIRQLWRFKCFRRLLIHTANNAIKELVGDFLSNEGFPVIMTGKNIYKDIKKWLNNEESILLSAGLGEGIDFKYDICRAQIILKLPKLGGNLDPYYRNMINNDKILYEWHIARTIVQASGRIVRAKDDVGLTIILDNRALKHYNKYIVLYPAYYKTCVRKLTLLGLMTVIEKYGKIFEDSYKVNKEEILLREYNIDKYLKLLAKKSFS